MPDAGCEPLRVTGFFATEASAIRGTLLDGSGARMVAEDLALEDFHALRAIGRRLGLIAEALVEVLCENCDERFQVLPSSTFELSAYENREFDEDDFDAPFDYSLPRDVPFAGAREDEDRGPSRLCLSPLTVGQAAPLHAALAAGSGVEIDASVVAGMGVAAIDGVREREALAAVLRRCPEDTLEGVFTWFEAAHYPRRLESPHGCPRCGAVAWVPCPARREFTDAGGADEGASARDFGRFPSLDEFERLVRRTADRVYRRSGVRNVGLLVSAGPADCDDSGVPLLGSYVPGDPDGTPPAHPEVTLYYRTFSASYDLDGPYDVEAEVEETIRHELEHHLAHLAGDDPVDAQERAEIADEYVRRVGRTAAEQRAIKSAIGDVRAFLRTTWWIWALALLGLWALFTRR